MTRSTTFILLAAAISGQAGCATVTKREPAAPEVRKPVHVAVLHDGPRGATGLVLPPSEVAKRVGAARAEIRELAGQLAKLIDEKAGLQASAAAATQTEELRNRQAKELDATLQSLLGKMVRMQNKPRFIRSLPQNRKAIRALAKEIEATLEAQGALGARKGTKAVSDSELRALDEGIATVRKSLAELSARTEGMLGAEAAKASKEVMRRILRLERLSAADGAERLRLMAELNIWLKRLESLHGFSLK